MGRLAGIRTKHPMAAGSIGTSEAQTARPPDDRSPGGLIEALCGGLSLRSRALTLLRLAGSEARRGEPASRARRAELALQHLPAFGTQRGRALDSVELSALIAHYAESAHGQPFRDELGKAYFSAALAAPSPSDFLVVMNSEQMMPMAMVGSATIQRDICQSPVASRSMPNTGE